MNILLFTDSLGAGGAQRQLCGLACLLKERGYNVKVVTYYYRPFYLYLLKENDIAYECLNIKSYWCYGKVVRSIRAFHADVVVAYQTVPSFIMCVCRMVCRFKLIVSERNTDTRTTWKHHIFFRAFRRADYVVPNSYSQGEFIQRTFPFLSERVHVISNFVDLARFTPQDGAVGSPRRLLVVASIKEAKNTKTFIEAYRLARVQGYTTTVRWYGLVPREGEVSEDYAYAQECIDMVKDYGLVEQIQLLPKIRDIDRAYREADVFCLPSLYEGTPNVICEAMASGLPVVCSAVCDNHYYVANAENGYLFDPHDPHDIAEKLLLVERLSPDTLRAMGRTSRAKVEALCSPATFVDRYIELIEH